MEAMQPEHARHVPAPLCSRRGLPLPPEQHRQRIRIGYRFSSNAPPASPGFQEHVRKANAAVYSSAPSQVAAAPTASASSGEAEPALDTLPPAACALPRLQLLHL